MATFSANAQVLQNGWSVVACKPQYPGNVTLAVKDITQFGTIWQNPANRGDDFEWSSQMPAGMMWSTADFAGQSVLSMSIDSRDGAIYTITSRAYAGFTPGPANVYHIDPISGVPTQIGSLPGNAGGSYIEVDEVNNQIFAIDMDTGKIHRLSMGGALLSDFDPGLPDDGAVGLPLVGERLLGVTYNPADNRNNLRSGKGRARSYVPTLYASTGQAVRHAPVDPLYGDLDEDGVPDLIVGRLAVQTKSQLKAIVDKTLAYPYSSHAGKALMVSDGRDDASRRSFREIGDFALSGLSGSWRSQHLSLQDLGVNEVKNRLLHRINDGLAITSWVGHSDRDVWGFDGVLSSADVAGLTNSGNPTIVMQWGCWNNYYVDPKPNSMTYRWLVAPDRGAAVSVGATTLMEAGSERVLARYIYEAISSGKTIGEAIAQSKRQLVEQFGVDSTRDLLGGFVILGDPAVRALVR